MKKSELVEDVIMLWLEQKKHYIKTSTYTYYLFEVKKYIIPQIGKLSVEELCEEVIQDAVLYWQTKGGSNNTPLNKSTVQNLVMLTKQFIRYALKNKYMKEISLNIQFLPIDYEKKNKVYSLDEQNKIISAIKKEQTYKAFGILLCINSGLRIGELCALRWEDFDFNLGVIHIQRTLQRIYNSSQTPKTRIVISSPKTKTSIRDIPLSKKLLDVICKSNDRNDNGYVLTNGDSFVEPRTYRKYYTDFLKRNKITPLNFHCLRHTFATRCIENGADYKTLSEILGHTSINTTLNMYVHPQLEEKRRCVELIKW